MTRKRNKVCGIDVHKAFVVATTLDRDDNSETKRYKQNFGSLIELRDWILSSKCEIGSIRVNS